MPKILFVCHGNICRSYMAQCICAELAKRRGLAEHYLFDSAATSREEIGNEPHPEAVMKLEQMGIPALAHHARQFQAEEYEDWDYIIYMDSENLWGLRHLHPKDPAHKYRKLLSFRDNQPDSHAADVADPWYTGDFDSTYTDIYAACTALIGRSLL